MQTEHLHRLIDEKKWTLMLREFDHAISKRESFEDMELLVSIFESIDKDYREQNAQKHYLEMWKIAFKIGKLKLAKNYAEFSLDYLIELKRVPAIKKLIMDLSSEGLLKNHKKFTLIDLILGKKGDSSLEDSGVYESHPEMWKDSKAALKNYLLLENDWSIEQWKLAYEYVLKFYYDRDLFLILADKATELEKSDHKKKILAFLHGKRVNIDRFTVKKQEKTKALPKSDLNVDYDQLAMDVISGVVEPSITEQRKILVSIQDLSSEELLTKGKDMVVAFGLLGMDKVVISLCERIVPLLIEVKDRAGIKFMMGQSLHNSGEFYRAIDLIEDILSEEPLLPEEALAFNYLKAESLFKLEKYKLAKELFLRIKRQSPHYRLVRERLRYIEEIK